MISLIVAHDESRCIGKEDWMPWNLPEDLKHFKALTLNKKILMGRKTFEGIKKPLPNRFTYVLTRHVQDYGYDNVAIVNNVKTLMEEYAKSEDILYVCGGAQIYDTCLPYVKEMWISLVDGVHEGDTFFPEYDLDEWIVVSKERKVGFTIIHYKRRK